MKEVEMMEKLKHHHRIVSYIKHELASHDTFPGKALSNQSSDYLMSCSHRN